MGWLAPPQSSLTLCGQAHSEDGYPDNLHHLSQTGMRAFLSTPDWARCQSAASPSQHHDQHSHYQEFGKDKEEEEENLCDTNAREEELNCHHVKDDKGGSSKGERLEEERDESASPTGGFLQIHTPG